MVYLGGQWEICSFAVLGYQVIYFLFMPKQVDLRYMSIDEPDFGLYIRLSGFYIATVSTVQLA